MSRLHLGIPEPHRKALLIRDDLLERLAEIKLEVRPFGPAEMGRAEDVRHGQERMVRVGDRLVFVNIDGGIARSALAPRAPQGSGFRELGPRRLRGQYRRLPPIEFYA